jgi:integrase
MNRYPKRGKGFRWTVKELEAIAPAWTGDTLADGNGLQGEVRAAAAGVIISWRYAYKSEGSTKRFYCGSWPAVPLEAIRTTRDQARAWVKSRVNPVDQKQADKVTAQRGVEATIADDQRRRTENLSFQDLFDAWIVDGVNRSDGNAELKRLFEKDVLPALGPKALRDLTEHDIRSVLRAVVARDANRLAVIVFGGIKQMLIWAEKRKPWRALLIEGNPAALVEIEKIVSTEYDLANVRDRVLSIPELRELRDIFARMEAEYEAAPNKRSAPRPVMLQTQCALWICLSTLSRIGETLMARWDEVDLEERTWFIPKENVKKTRAGARDHMIFLSDFAVAKFKRLKERTGHSDWCFPAKHNQGHVVESTVGKQVGDRQAMFMDRKAFKNRRQDNSLVLAAGKNGNWTPHDMRRTGATIMETLGIEDKIIDLCQNHVIHTGKNKIRRHYLHGDNTERMREAWLRLGVHLESHLPFG